MCHVTICSHPLLVLAYWCYLFAKLCLTLCDPMGCYPPGSCVYGISQAKVLEWVTISCSRESSWLRDQTHISCTGRQILYHWATRDAWCWFVECSVASVVSNSLWPHGPQPYRLLCTWSFPGKNTGVGCHFLLQRIFSTQELNLHLLRLLHCRQILTT